MRHRRRLFVALGAASLSAPRWLLAQTPAKVWRVGFLTLRARPESFDLSAR